MKTKTDEDGAELLDLRDAAQIFDNTAFSAICDFFEKADTEPIYTRPLKVKLTINGKTFKFSEIVKHMAEMCNQQVIDRAGDLVRGELAPLFAKANSMSNIAEEADQNLKRKIREVLPDIRFDDDDND